MSRQHDRETSRRCWRPRAVRSPSLDYVVDFRIDVVDPTSSWKERTAAYSMIASGKDLSFVLMREPEQFYPGLLLIAEGLTNAEIAERLYVSEATVKTHVRHILEKLRLRNRAEAAAFAVRGRAAP